MALLICLLLKYDISNKIVCLSVGCLSVYVLLIKKTYNFGILGLFGEIKLSTESGGHANYYYDAWQACKHANMHACHVLLCLGP